jgi:hypothetical protein
VTASKVPDQPDQFLRHLVEDKNQPETSILKGRVQVAAEVVRIHNFGLCGLTYDIKKGASAEVAAEDVVLELLHARAVKAGGIRENLSCNGPARFRVGP